MSTRLHWQAHIAVSVLFFRYLDMEKELERVEKRELMEETGFGGGTWTKLMTLSPNPSTMTNLCHSFLARGVVKTGNQCLDATEDLEFLLVPREEVREMLLEGKFIQALMVAPLYKYFFGL